LLLLAGYSFYSDWNATATRPDEIAFPHSLKYGSERIVTHRDMASISYWHEIEVEAVQGWINQGGDRTSKGPTLLICAKSRPRVSDSERTLDGLKYSSEMTIGAIV
jgi:hypothetical protein